MGCVDNWDILLPKYETILTETVGVCPLQYTVTKSMHANLATFSRNFYKLTMWEIFKMKEHTLQALYTANQFLVRNSKYCCLKKQHLSWKISSVTRLQNMKYWQMMVFFPLWHWSGYLTLDFDRPVKKLTTNNCDYCKIGLQQLETVVEIEVASLKLLLMFLWRMYKRFWRNTKDSPVVVSVWCRISQSAMHHCEICFFKNPYFPIRIWY